MDREYAYRQINKMLLLHIYIIHVYLDRERENVLPWATDAVGPSRDKVISIALTSCQTTD